MLLILPCVLSMKTDKVQLFGGRTWPAEESGGHCWFTRRHSWMLLLTTPRPAEANGVVASPVWPGNGLQDLPESILTPQEAEQSTMENEVEGSSCSFALHSPSLCPFVFSEASWLCLY